MTADRVSDTAVPDPPGSDGPAPGVGDLIARLDALGIHRVRSWAWRDLADPSAGGSEVHADEILSRWAAAGLDVEHRTSGATGRREFTRHGYRVIQRGGRMGVFPQVIGREALRRTPAGTAAVEIWNGVPWLSPLWHRGPRVVWLHHIHEHMWAEVLPGPLAALGRLTETRIAPRVYRRERVVTLSDSVAAGIAALGIDPARISVISPGVDAALGPDPGVPREADLVVVVARLAPVKRVEAALAAVASVRAAGRAVRVEVIGDGPSRGDIARWIHTQRATDWVTLRGRVPTDEVRRAYLRARLVVSASHSEGWGMVLTEAAACGTPAVATDIPGHRSAVRAGVTGDLVPLDDLGPAIAALLADTQRWEVYSAAATRYASGLSWDRVAARHLEVLCAETERRPGQRPGDRPGQRRSSSSPEPTR